MAHANAMDAAAAVAAELESRGVPYAIGGALAYGVWAIPRGTLDIDLNVFVGPERLDPVFEAFHALGIEVSEENARREAASEGAFRAWFGDFRLDVFTPSIDFSWEAMRTRRKAKSGGTELWFLSAEALAVFKLLFFRPKDLVDLERLLATQGARLDRGYVRRHLVEMLGEDDARVAKWDDLARAV